MAMPASAVKRVVKSSLLWNRGFNRAGIRLGKTWHFNFSTLRPMRLPQPNLAIIGAMKSGTTSLYNYISGHPQVFMSPIKEPGYFLEPSDSRYGPQYESANDLRSHRSDDRLLFAMLNGYGGEPIFGEASTHYTKTPEHGSEVPRRCKELSPSIKFIYLMRDPFGRMVSQYLHSRRHGYTSSDFNRAVRDDDLYVAFSLYGMQIRKFLGEFGRDRFLLLRLEDLDESFDETMSAVWRFIGVEPHHMASHRVHHAAQNAARVPADDLLLTRDNYERILHLFRDDLAELKETTGFDSEVWDLSADRWARP